MGYFSFYSVIFVKYYILKHNYVYGFIAEYS